MDKKFCVIGKSLPHTFSPEIHGMFGLDYGWVELYFFSLECNEVSSNEL